MAYQTIMNCAYNRANYFTLFIIVTLFFCAFCAHDDFSDDDYYELPEDSSEKEHHLSKEEKASNLSAERKLQDYLLSINSHVFANNDVLTVKERKPPTSITKQPLEKFTDHQAKPSPHVDNIQSDQPYSSLSPEYSQTAGSKKPSTEVPVLNANKPAFLKDPYVVRTNSSAYRNVSSEEWNCQFKANDDCEIVNDLAVGNYFHLKSRNLFHSFQPPSWYLLLNASTLPDSAAGARLITPYMKTGNVSQGCLSVHFITAGSGVQQINLYQQDKGNYCIWNRRSQLNYPSEVPVNNKFEFTIDLFRGSPRFFLELYLDLTRAYARQNTIFALANMRLSYQPCSVDSRNHCRPLPSSTRNDHGNVMP